MGRAEQIEIDIEATDTIRRIKERVEEKQGIQPDQQKWDLFRCFGVLSFCRLVVFVPDPAA